MIIFYFVFDLFKIIIYMCKNIFCINNIVWVLIIDLLCFVFYFYLYNELFLFLSCVYIDFLKKYYEIWICLEDLIVLEFYIVC